MLIGGKWCLEGNNKDDKISRNALNVWYRLQKAIFLQSRGIVSDISISFEIFSVH